MKLDLTDTPEGTYTLTVHESGGYTLTPNKPQPLKGAWRRGEGIVTDIQSSLGSYGTGSYGNPPMKPGQLGVSGGGNYGVGRNSHDPRPLSPEDMEAIREANPWMKDHRHG